MALVESQGPKEIWETREMLVALAMKCLTMIRFDKEDDIRGVKFKKIFPSLEISRDINNSYTDNISERFR